MTQYNKGDKVVIIYDDIDYIIRTVTQKDHLGYILDDGQCFNLDGKGLRPYKQEKVEQLDLIKTELEMLKDKQTQLIKGW